MDPTAEPTITLGRGVLEPPEPFHVIVAALQLLLAAYTFSVTGGPDLINSFKTARIGVVVPTVLIGIWKRINASCWSLAAAFALRSVSDPWVTFPAPLPTQVSALATTVTSTEA